MTRRQTFVLTCCLSKKISNIIVCMIKMGWLYYYYSQQVCPFQYIFEIFSRDLHLCLEWSRWHYGKLSSIQKSIVRIIILDEVDLKFWTGSSCNFGSKLDRSTEQTLIASMMWHHMKKKRFFWKCDDGLNEEKIPRSKNWIFMILYQLTLPNIVRTKIV